MDASHAKFCAKEHCPIQVFRAVHHLFINTVGQDGWKKMIEVAVFKNLKHITTPPV